MASRQRPRRHRIDTTETRPAPTNAAALTASILPSETPMVVMTTIRGRPAANRDPIADRVASRSSLLVGAIEQTSPRLRAGAEPPSLLSFPAVLPPEVTGLELVGWNVTRT